ncbi:MAG: H(+)/Cl(-) exchange transporter ClcA [Geminicoccaceae bacterium]
MTDQPETSDPTADLGTKLYWLALLAGLLTGLLGAGFHGLIDHVTAWRTAFVDGRYDESWIVRSLADCIARTRVPLNVPVETAARLLLLFLLVATALGLARLLVRRFAPETSGSGVQEIEGYLLGLRQMRWPRILTVKFIGGGLALGAGFVLGREGPTVQMGGAAGLGIAAAGGCNRAQTRALVAAGAGAGIAAAFNAPIAGALFVIEELRRASPYSFGGYHAVLIACVAATLVTEVFAGVGPQLRLAIDPPALADYPLYIALGVLLGAAGAVFNHLVLVTLDFLGAWSRRAPTTLVLSLALGLTALLWTMPLTTGGGEQIVPMLTAASPGFATLLLLLAVRTLATLLSYGAGAPGGIFAPILALATLAGVTFAEAARLVLPDFALEPTAVAAAAMAALFTGSVRAPLVGVVLVAELTDAYSALVAVTLCSAVASLTAAAVGGKPLYELLLERTLRLAR